MVLTRVTQRLVRGWREWRLARQTARGGALITSLSLPVRLALWSLLGVGVFFGLRAAIYALAPANADPNFDVATPWATLYVACTKPACRHTFSTRQPMGFHDWPIACPACGERSGERAAPCGRCGKWISQSQSNECWHCAELRAATQPRKPPRNPNANPDDDEDGW